MKILDTVAMSVLICFMIIYIGKIGGAPAWFITLALLCGGWIAGGYLDDK